MLPSYTRVFAVLGAVGLVLGIACVALGAPTEVSAIAFCFAAVMLVAIVHAAFERIIDGPDRSKDIGEKIPDIAMREQPAQRNQDG